MTRAARSAWTIGVAIALTVASATGVAAAPADAPPSSAPTASPTASTDSPVPGASPSASPSPSPSAPPSGAPAVAVPRLDSVSRNVGEVAASRLLVFRGSGLDSVTALRLGAQTLTALHHIGTRRLTARLGPSPRFRTATATFFMVIGHDSIRTALRFRFVATAARSREMAWASANLVRKTYSWGHAYLPGEDCANFASHALRVRGLPRAVLTISSTALRTELVTGLHRTELRDSQAARRRVRIGDLIQFDWHPHVVAPHDRDHTAIVSALSVDRQGRTVIRYIAHTDPFDSPKWNQTIEGSLLSPGHDPHGKVFFILV